MNLNLSVEFYNARVHSFGPDTWHTSSNHIRLVCGYSVIWSTLGRLQSSSLTQELKSKNNQKS